MTKSAPVVVHSDPEIMGGTPVFVGTRVPFQTLLDYLEAGDPLFSPVRILLDECLPRRLKRNLPGHEVRTLGSAEPGHVTRVTE